MRLYDTDSVAGDDARASRSGDGMQSLQQGRWEVVDDSDARQTRQCQASEGVGKAIEYDTMQCT